MAELEVGEGELVLRLSLVEKAEGVHGDLHVALAAVRSVEVIDDAHEMTRVKTGFKVGMRVPGSASVAVVRSPGRKMFVAVHHDTPRGVRVVLEGDSFDEWIVGAADPESVVANLELQIVVASLSQKGLMPAHRPNAFGVQKRDPPTTRAAAP